MQVVSWYYSYSVKIIVGRIVVKCLHSHVVNPNIICSLSQFQKYLESDETVNPPVKLEPCLSAAGDQIYLTEPLVGNS